MRRLIWRRSVAPRDLARRQPGVAGVKAGGVRHLAEFACSVTAARRRNPQFRTPRPRLRKLGSAWGFKVSIEHAIGGYR